MKGAILTRIYFPKMRPQTFSTAPLGTSLSNRVFMETLSPSPAGARDVSGWQHQPLARDICHGHHPSTAAGDGAMPLGTWWEEAAAPGPGFPSGIITRGPRRCSHSRAGRLPRPFPLDIPELTHRAHDCETCQEILLGIRSVCLMGVRIFLPLSRPAGCRAHGAGQGTHHGPQTQQDLRDKPACPGCILRVSTPSSDPPSQGGFSTRKENTKSTQNPPALTPYLLCFSQHGDFFHLETGS